MLLPLDRRINDRIPVGTFGLVAANTACFFAFFWSAGNLSGLQDLWLRFGCTPASPSLPAAVTHLFIHAGWEHLIGNMLFLIFFGMNSERKLGTALYLGLYFLSGFGALALFVLFNRGSTVPLGGASGAISGVTGMYLALFARRETEVLWFLGVAAGTLRVPAWTFTLLWAGSEFAQAALLNGKINVANWAHVGGFMVGLGGVAMLQKLFGFKGRPESVPKAPRSDTFSELSYIPVQAPQAPAGRPDTALLRDPKIQSFILVARQFGDPAPGAARILDSAKASPACLARGLSFLAAQELQQRLEAAGTPTFLFSERHLVNVPPLRLADGISFEQRRVVFRDVTGEAVARDLSALYLLSAGDVRTPGGVRTFLDVFTTSPWTDFRLAGADTVGFARELRARAGRTPAANNVAVLAEGGRLPGEPFRDLAEYDAFNLWMLQVYASGIYRKAAD